LTELREHDVATPSARSVLRMVSEPCGSRALAATAVVRVSVRLSRSRHA
jgi:hypothetical protein